MFAWKERERKRKEHRLHVCWLTDWHESMAQCAFTPIDVLGLWYYWTCCLVMSRYCCLVSLLLSSCATLCLSSHVIPSSPALVALEWKMLHRRSCLYMPFCSEVIRVVQVCSRSIFRFMTWTQDGRRAKMSAGVERNKACLIKYCASRWSV